MVACGILEILWTPLLVIAVRLEVKCGFLAVTVVVSQTTENVMLAKVAYFS
jgi:hypothetical protein